MICISHDTITHSRGPIKSQAPPERPIIARCLSRLGIVSIYTQITRFDEFFITLGPALISGVFDNKPKLFGTTLHGVVLEDYNPPVGSRCFANCFLSGA